MCCQQYIYKADSLQFNGEDSFKEICDLLMLVTRLDLSVRTELEVCFVARFH
jgi:hypothetical protein